MPPAISVTARRVRRAPVRTPYGPSTKTRVPTARCRICPLSSPSSLTVNRSQRPLGADEIEYGWARHQPSRVRKRSMKYWPERTAQPVEVAALEVERYDAGRLVDDARDAQPMAHRGHHRLADAERQHERGRQRRTAPIQ